MSFSITNLCIKATIILIKNISSIFNITTPDNIIKMVKTFIIISVLALALILISENPVKAYEEPESSLSEILRSIIDIIRNFIDNILTGKTVDKNQRPRNGRWFK